MLNENTTNISFKFVHKMIDFKFTKQCFIYYNKMM